METAQTTIETIAIVDVDDDGTAYWMGVAFFIPDTEYYVEQQLRWN